MAKQFYDLYRATSQWPGFPLVPMGIVMGRDTLDAEAKARQTWPQVPSWDLRLLSPGEHNAG